MGEAGFAVRELAASIDALLLRDVRLLSDAELAAEVTALMRESTRLQAGVSRLVAERSERAAGADGVCVGVGDRVEAGLLPAPTGAGEAMRWARRGHAVHGLPRLAALHAAGELSTAVLDAAAMGLTRLSPSLWSTLDALVAEAAATVPPKGVTQVVEQLRVMSMPEVVDRKAVEASERRGLWITASGDGPDAEWRVSGSLHGVRGEMAARVIESFARPCDEADRRTAAQRRADALAELCAWAAGGGSAPSGADSDQMRTPGRLTSARRLVQPRVTVIAPLAAVVAAADAPGATTDSGSLVDPGQLAALLCDHAPDVLVVDDAAAAGPGSPGPDSRGPDSRGPGAVVAGEAVSTGSAAGGEATTLSAYGDKPVDPAVLERIRRGLAGLVGGGVAPALVPLVYGQGRRLATRAQRAALIARDGGCVGCGRDPAWCEVHHLREFTADGGATDIANLALLCWECHVLLHRRREHLHPPWCVCRACELDGGHAWVARGCVPEVAGDVVSAGAVGGAARSARGPAGVDRRGQRPSGMPAGRRSPPAGRPAAGRPPPRARPG